MMKRCLKCGVEKSITEFDVKTSHSSGYSSTCKECYKPIRQAYWEKNKKELKKRRKEYLENYWRDPKNQIRAAERARERGKLSPKTSIRVSLHNALKRRPTEDAATLADLMEIFSAQKGRCALSGLVMTWNKGGVLPTSISLDRVDPNGGYSKDNLRLVCHAVNSFRGRMTDAEMLTMAKAIVNNSGKSAWVKAGQRIAAEDHRGVIADRKDHVLLVYRDDQMYPYLYRVDEVEPLDKTTGETTLAG